MKNLKDRESTNQEQLIGLTRPKKLNLESVILFYQEGHFEHRAASEKGLGPVIPFDKEYLQNVNSMFKKHMAKSNEKKKQIAVGGKIPENLLYSSSVTQDRHSVIWREQEGSHYLKWNGGKHYDGLYYFPTMIIGLISGSVSLLIEQDGKYYVPNFPNFFNEGNMCHGSVEINFKPKMTWQEMIDFGRSAFFDTMFSHHIKGTMFEKMYNQKELKCELKKPLSKKEMKAHPLLSWL